MVQAAEPGSRDDLLAQLCASCRYAIYWRLLRQSEMSPVVVVITDVLGHEPFQVTVVQHDNVIEQVTSAGANETFCDAVLPRALEAGLFGLYFEASDRFNNIVIEITAPAEDQVTRRSIVRERFAQLL